MKRIIIIVLSLAIIFGFLFWKFGPQINLFNKPKPEGPIQLTFWGLWEDDNLIKPVILEYQKQHPGVTINYERKSSNNYRTRVKTQIEAEGGPDVIMIHNSWLGMFAADLLAAPSDIWSLPEYRSTFYPVAVDAFVKGASIYAAPLGIDGLGLFYNEDLLNAVSGKVPKNWQEFIETATKMTVRDANGIKTAGVAIGTTANVDNWSDILGLLLIQQQPGVDFSNLATAQAAEVLRFYTSFITDPRRKVWDASLPKSTDMFAQGRLGFYLAPSWRAHEIRVANPNLKFKIAPVPQLPGAIKQVGWASFWGQAVSAKSKNPKEAWKFVKYLTSAEAEKLMYQEAAKVRLFGEPYSRVDLAGELINDPLTGAIVTQGPSYKFWYLSSNTFDLGINDEMIKYFEDGVNATLQGGDPQTLLKTVDAGVKQILDKYTKPAPVPSSK